MSSTFDYLLDKIAGTPFAQEPYAHLEITDFLSREHFDAIVSDPLIAIEKMRSTEELLATLQSVGYEIIDFPGCVTSTKAYLDWYHGRSHRKVHDATEAFGLVHRLKTYRGGLLADLNEFFHSEALRAVLVERFGITQPVTIDAGIQKYLHGYEISPHPDVRRKALTWMLNINPGRGSEDQDYHTHYLAFKERWRWIGEFWRTNPEFDRDWVPWDWCETRKRQRKNNSIVFFAPSDETIHAIKASYDHLPAQRTQSYGNLWYTHSNPPKITFHHFDFARRDHSRWNEHNVGQLSRLADRVAKTRFGDVLRGATSSLRTSPLGRVFRTH